VTRQLAGVLRKNTTRPERDAWTWLRTLRDEGIAVRRQHPIGRYIADFVVMRSRVAIEIDGPLHEQQRDADAERDAAFARLGWRVVRFTPVQVAEGPTFLAAVRAACTPSPRGEGAGGGVRRDASSKAPRSNTLASSSDGEDLPAPQPPPLAGRGSLRRTRANRALPPRRKT